MVGIGRLHDEGAKAAHLLVKEANRVLLMVVGAEGVGANQFSERSGLVDRGRLLRAHLVKHDGDAAAGDLPRRFAPGETAADDMDGLHHPVDIGIKPLVNRNANLDLVGGGPAVA